MKPRIVCAANYCLSSGIIFIGIRHYDAYMRKSIESYREAHNFQVAGVNCIQGFVDQFGTFYVRTEAWKIAEENGQILRRVGGDTTNGGTLYSENLY